MKSIILLFLLGSTAFAQDFQTVALVPLALGEQEGAYSTRWSTTLSVHNKSGTTVTNVRCPGQGWIGLPLPMTVVPPKATVDEDWRQRASPATLICFEEPGPADLAFSLQVREIGTRAEAPPVEVPVVLQEDFLHDTAALVNVPFSDDTRAALRIYDLSGDHGTVFRVQAFDRSGALVLDELVVRARQPTHTENPGYILIQDLAVSFPVVSGHEKLTFHVAPLTFDVPFWTFISVTDNQTQAFTTFLP